ncbi:hypothetical protein LPJ61_005904 [Coemansia biformis]|uniref:Chitosanase n=1 Tax=Coemansia biformis TaxID=1286918 RepID=A0A9W7XX99_9FUNG|nr:hypothetical protein LPJ61_005904 [Coemansia biformis]
MSFLSTTGATPVTISTPLDTDNINYKCAFRVTYQLLGYLNTGKVTGGYSECSKSDGGDGYVAGIMSFTTKWGSMLDVVNAYKATPNYKKEFDALIPTLEKYSKETSGSVEGLDKLCDAWGAASKNSNYFKNAQISVARSQYDYPALNATESLNLRFPISKSVMINTAIVGGLGNSGYELGAVFGATNATIKGDVKGGSGSTLTIDKYSVDEIAWLSTFLDTRDKLSKSSSKPVTDIYRGLIKNGFYKFSDTIAFTGFDNKQVSIACNKLY